MKVSLVMVSDDGTSRPLPEMSLPITIGRGDDCKLRIPLAAVSRHHCELLDDDDELIVRDLKSSNGTFVNKERVQKRELVPGDLICVGGLVFVVRIDGHPKAVDPVITFANGAVSLDDLRASAAEMDGVPTWSGNASPSSKPAKPDRSTNQRTGPGGAASGPSAKPTPSKGQGPSKGPAPSSKSPAADDSSFESLLSDLSESDFDIDLPDDDGGPGSKPPAGGGQKK